MGQPDSCNWNTYKDRRVAAVKAPPAVFFAWIPRLDYEIFHTGIDIARGSPIRPVNP